MNNGVENIPNNDMVNYQAGVQPNPSLSVGTELQPTITPSVEMQSQALPTVAPVVETQQSIPTVSPTMGGQSGLSPQQAPVQPSLTPANPSYGQPVSANPTVPMNSNAGGVGQAPAMSSSGGVAFSQPGYPGQVPPSTTYLQAQGAPATQQPAAPKEVEYTPPSTFKVLFMIILFLGIVAFVYFLPDISEMLQKDGGDSNYDSEFVPEDEEKTVSGDLICTLAMNDERFDTEYRLEFHHTDSELEKTKIVVTTKGDASLDSTELDLLNLTCQGLKNDVLQMEGVTVSCNYTAGKMVETQTYDLSKMNSEEAMPSFAEAGGIQIDYPYQCSIHKIQENMTENGYTCQMN